MKLKVKKEPCTHCGAVVANRAGVSIRITNPWQRYVTSGRAIIRVANARLCQKCYKSFEKKLDQLLSEY